MTIPALSDEFWHRVSDLRIAVFGDLMLDRHIIGRCERVSPEAPVVVVRSEEESSSLGGAGNVVRNVYSLGAQASVFGVVGNDLAGREIEKALKLLGADTSGVFTSKDRMTIEKSRVLAQNQHVVRIDREHSEPISEALAARLIDAFEFTIDEFDVVLVSDYLKGVCVPFLLQAVLTRAKKAGLPVIVDPKGRGYARYQGATCVTPNAVEAALELGFEIRDDPSAEEAGRKLAAMIGAPYVLITRGGQGMTLTAPAGTHHLLAQARQVYDVSGAGDTVVATLSIAVGAGLDWRSAAELANHAAGIVVGKVATVPIHRWELATAGVSDQPSSNRVLDLDQLAALLATWRSAGRRIVFTNGCFDILHRGHIHLFERSRVLGDILIVGLNSDASVARLKGPRRPFQSQVDRAHVLAALSAVDAVVIFDEDDPLELVKLIRPDVLTKGDDYTIDTIVGADLVLSGGGRVETIPKIDGLSTSRLVSDISKTGIT